MLHERQRGERRLLGSSESAAFTRYYPVTLVVSTNTLGFPFFLTALLPVDYLDAGEMRSLAFFSALFTG